MIVEARQSFALVYPGPAPEALDFLRDPVRSLRHVRFLRDLSRAGDAVRAELVVGLPMLGELHLPFESELLSLERGAELRPRELTGNAWAELVGHGEVMERGQSESELRYRLHVLAHLTVPAASKWGGGAFEKMVRAAAARTLERVAHEFPEGVRQAMS